MSDLFDSPRLGRPRGELRSALADASTQLVQQRGCFTARDAAAFAKAAFEDARITLKDMVRAGDLVVIGGTRVPGVCRPMNLYSIPGEAPASDLFTAVRSWAEFR